MGNKDQSSFLGVSIRGWLAIIMTLTVCAMSATGLIVSEPLYSAFLLSLGFYFGQKDPTARPGNRSGYNPPPAEDTFPDHPTPPPPKHHPEVTS